MTESATGESNTVIFYIQFFKNTNFSCSEFSIDLDTLKALVPSRCDLDVEVCRRTCHAIGRREGMCLDDEVRGKVLDKTRYDFVLLPLNTY